MSKKREIQDAFGLSFLDVLSNALSGVILLILILAATMNGNDKRKLYLPNEGARGVNYTELNFKKSDDFDLVDSVLVVQFEFDSEADFNISTLGCNTCMTSIKKFEYEGKQKQSIVIIRRGEINNDWSVNITPTNNFPDVVYTHITWNANIICAGTYEKSSDELLSVGRGRQPTIKVFGQLSRF